MNDQQNLQQLLQLQQLTNHQIQLQQQQLPKHRFITFNGPINAPASNSFRLALCQLINQGAEEITILFSSSGGSVDDGIALYTYIQSIPAKITMHAIGIVGSIAIPVFLAAPNRFASKNSRFFFHDFTWTFATQLAPRTMIHEASILLKNALDWTEELLKSTTKLTDKDIKRKKLLKEPHIMSPSDALKFGIVQSESEPSYGLVNIPLVVI
jgi:ATP-dependent Clp protease protease subunit